MISAYSYFLFRLTGFIIMRSINYHTNLSIYVIVVKGIIMVFFGYFPGLFPVFLNSSSTHYPKRVNERNGVCW